MEFKDIYIRDPLDPNYVFGVYEHSNEVESIIAKIKVLFGTRQGQVLGDFNIGLGIEDLIFETRINKFDLEEKIKRQIDQYVDESSEYAIEPRVSFGKTDEYDYAVIDILIDQQAVLGILVK